MNYQINSETKKKIGRWATNILLYLLVLYTFYMLGFSVWNNYLLQKQITNIQNQIASTQKNNKDLQNLIVYYQSESFQEVQARSELGLKKPGETVVDVPTQQINNFNTELQNQTQDISANQPAPTVANYRLWWQYFTR